MKRFFQIHYEKVLILLALFCLFFLASLYIWSGQFLLTSFNKTTDVEVGGGGEVHFDITGAAALKLGE